MSNTQFARCGVALPIVMIAATAVTTAPALARESRSIDGSGNNQIAGRDSWGSASIQLKRKGAAWYQADGFSPVFSGRPNPRDVSNGVFAQSGSMLNDRNLSDMVWQFGQFLDHDLDLTPTDPSASETWNIAIPNGDPTFPDGTVLDFQRSAFDPATGAPGDPRQQMNAITAYIDASNIYGSDETRAAWLRDPSNRARLRTSAGDMLPYNDGTQENDNGPIPGDGTNMFVSGDIRANEQVGLTSMHTLFMREHNRLADKIAKRNPGMSEDDVYESARRIVGAEMQKITYKEFLPALLGKDNAGGYTGYDDSVDASIRNEFSTALYRLGHSMISDELQLEGGGSYQLKDAFFNPSFVETNGIESILGGLASQQMQEIDAKIVDGLRNFLFGAPGAGGLDLASLNIQRGRDHGLPDYNTLRAAYGLSTVSSFDDINPAVAGVLRSLYGQTAGADNVHLLDSWVGALAEVHLPGSSVGELIQAGLMEQFNALRNGDRFYFEHDAELTSVLALAGMSMDDFMRLRLSDIMERNTDLAGLNINVFKIPAPGPAALAGLACLASLRRRRARAA